MRSQDHYSVYPDTTLCAAVAEARRGAGDQLTRIMQAHNQRLFRIARSILRDDFEAEEIVQETFIRAFTNADELRDENKISAWLSRIAANLARDRYRQVARRNGAEETSENLDVVPIHQVFQDDNDARFSPERHAAMSDVRRMIESEIDVLPDGFREVFMLRVIEQMSVEETADTLALKPATVKTRLHRAKSLLKKALDGRLDAESLNAFPFGGVHCARTTETVLRHLQKGYLPR